MPIYYTPLHYKKWYILMHFRLQIWKIRLINAVKKNSTLVFKNDEE